MLFTIEPSALRNVAQQGLTHYLESIDETKITTRPDMLIALQGYLVQCSPAAIEANINNAASGAPSVVSTKLGEAAAAAMAAAPSAALLAKARIEGVKPVQAAPPPIPLEQRPANLIGDEPALRLYSGDIMTIQKALGVRPATGDIGKLGSPTREAIAEFQYGMSAQDPSGWPSFKKPGELNQRTADQLKTLVPMPGPETFGTPFERAFLGNPGGHTRIDPARVDDILVLLHVTADELKNSSDRVKLMRDKIGAFRSDKKQLLDHDTYEKLQLNLPSGV